MKSVHQLALRLLVRAREDFQDMRKRMDNRIGRKADGSAQDLKEARMFTIEDLENFKYIADEAHRMEGVVEKMMKKHLVEIPVYNDWLSKVKGVGPISAGWILGEIDIEIATTVSKIWQFAGMNPGLVLGKKRVKAKDYKKEMGPIIKEIVFDKKKTENNHYIVQTDEPLRGDRATPGYVLPYNKKLRTVLIGVLADSFIKQNAPYRLKYYDTNKTRLENESSLIVNPDEKRKRKDDWMPWKDVSKGHRDAAAKRYMIKMFLKDLYVAWRTAEGLTVRAPYAEEYLGKKHFEPACETSEPPSEPA